LKKTWDYETFSCEVETAGMDPKDRAVMDVLEAADGTKVHQIDIARSEPWLGCHPNYEADLPIPDPTASTLRGIRGRINRLRRKHHVPILSEPKVNGGYWYPKKEAEIYKNMADMRKRAMHQALGTLRTYDDMLVTFQGKVPADPFFESYRKFLESFKDEDEPPPEEPPSPSPKPPPPPKPPPKKKKPPKNGGQRELGL
jgi:hypothetical protein